MSPDRHYRLPHTLFSPRQRLAGHASVDSAPSIILLYLPYRWRAQKRPVTGLIAAVLRDSETVVSSERPAPGCRTRRNGGRRPVHAATAPRSTHTLATSLASFHDSGRGHPPRSTVTQTAAAAWSDGRPGTIDGRPDRLDAAESLERAASTSKNTWRKNNIYYSSECSNDSRTPCQKISGRRTGARPAIARRDVRCRALDLELSAVADRSGGRARKDNTFQTPNRRNRPGEVPRPTRHRCERWVHRTSNRTNDEICCIGPSTASLPRGTLLDVELSGRRNRTAR